MPEVALTFDDGPSSWTPEILDLLAEHDARATFFVIGSVAASGLPVLERALAAGHELANHTWSHPSLAHECDEPRVRDELERTSAELQRLTGLTPTRFRAPRYEVDARVEAIAADLGLVHTRGDITPPDWQDGIPARVIATLVLQQLAPDTVIGLHDGVPPTEVRPDRTRAATVAALAVVLPRLAERGYRCVTASELLGRGSQP